jgi:cell division transport system permease protein
MFTILSRIIHFGLKNFWRNSWLSVATVAVMVLALVVFINLILFGVVTDKAVSSIQDKIDISVYFKNNTAEDQILSIKQSIETMPEVKIVDYISTDRALEIFKEKHKDDPTITSAVEELGDNPLQASLNIKAKDPDQYAIIAQYFSGSPSINQYVDSISYYKNQDVIDRLNEIVKNVNRGGLTLTIILTLIASLMIFNTIWLAIFSNRDEIGIMRVVGASNSLVRGPYMVEGVAAGVLAAFISVIIEVPVIYYVSPYLNQFIPGLEMFRYFYLHIFSMLGYQLLFGIIIGAFSSFIAVRRYLKN